MAKSKKKVSKKKSNMASEMDKLAADKKAILKEHAKTVRKSTAGGNTQDARSSRMLNASRLGDPDKFEVVKSSRKFKSKAAKSKAARDGSFANAKEALEAIGKARKKIRKKKK